MNNYVVFHCHSDMSNGVTNIDSVTKYQDYIDRAAELGMDSLAFSEHGSVFAWYDKKEKIEAAGMKYIHAEEFYITEKIDFDEDEKPIKLRDNMHCVLIAKNYEGVKEINRLSTKSFNRQNGHYYYVPRITLDDIINTTDNIIVTSACFKKGTPVLTNNGYVPIETIKRGDLVVNRYGELEKVNFPTQRQYNGIAYRISFQGGHTIECTGDHKLLTVKGNNTKKPVWIEAKNLNIQSGSEKHICLFPISQIYYSNKNTINKDEFKGSYWKYDFKGAKPLKQTMPNTIVITPEIMRFFGLFLGDGHITMGENPRVGITFNIKEFNRYWDSFMATASKQLGITWSITTREKHNCVDVAAYSKEFFDFMYYIFGDYNAFTKKVPDMLMHISKELDMELFLGYMLADGYFRNNKISKNLDRCGKTSEFVASSVSCDLIHDMMHILDTLHIFSNIRTHNSYVGKDGTKHNKSFYLYSRAYDLGNINKLSNNTHENIIKLFDNASQKFENRDLLFIDGVWYKKVRIKSKEEIKINETVYCLNNNTHSFVCNNVIVHNCLGGILNRGNTEVKKKFAKFMIENKHRCFLEVQHHNVHEQKVYNLKLLEIHKRYDIPLIAGTDTHALNREHEKGRKILQISKNIHFDDEEGWDLTFKSYGELCDAYKQQGVLSEEVYLEAINNTNRMANMIEAFDVDKSTKYPHIYDNSEKTFKEKINEACKNHPYLKNRYPREQIAKKIKEEFAVYKKMGSIDFMLLETYLREWEKTQGIQCGYSRGSVSGSLIAYILGITQMDSIKFNLNFFRFANPERVTNADIDTDYCSYEREKVKYFLLHDKLNLPNIKTSEIITFNTIAMKGAIKDVCRALNISLDTAQVISDAVYLDEKKKWVIDDKWREDYPELFEYVDIVSGTIVSIGSHPSGVLVSDKDIESDIGLCSLATSEYPVSMLDMHSLDTLFYVKLDILGLDNIGVINECCKMVGIERLTPDNVNLEDEKVWKSICDDTTLIFQWESDSAQAYLKKFMSDSVVQNAKSRDKNFSYIKWFSFGNGLIRPACASYRDEVANGIFYDNGFKELNEFLAPEAGRVCMQETIMQFLVKFCGYSNAESDNVRRGIAKKKGTATLLPEIERRFIEYSSANYDITKEKCAEVIKPFLDIILAASSYAFSWNHSDSYSCIGYISGYLRYYYPLEFLTAAFNTFFDKEDKVANITKYADKIGVKILSPKFRYSRSNYQMDKETNSIYKGLQSIKYINEDVGKALYEMKDKHIENFSQMINEFPGNSRQLEVLTRLDFFKEFGSPGELLKIIEIYDKYYNGKQISKDKVDESIKDYIENNCDKETKKQYKFENGISISQTQEIAMFFENKPWTAFEIVNSQREYLGYIEYKNDSFDPSIYCVFDLITYKGSKTPSQAILYRIKDGTTLTVRLKKKNFNEGDLTRGSFIQLPVVEWLPKKKKNPSTGKWEETDEYYYAISDWNVLRKYLTK